MTEPRRVASGLEQVVDGVYHWRIRNPDIGGAVSSSHAVVSGDTCVLIDPVGLEPKALHALPHVAAIVLTATCHQRAAWRYRAELKAPVWMPEGARPGEHEPDHRYGEGDELPGGLVAIHTPGPDPAHYSLLLERDGGVLFVSDLVGNDETEVLDLVPGEFQDDHALALKSIERLLDLPFAVLCLDHGMPLTQDPKAELRRALSATPAQV